MEIVVKEFSGLGNQLFQYAAGRYYANLHDANLRLALEVSHRTVSHGGFPRPLLLKHFVLATEASTLTVWDRLILSEQANIRAALTPLKKALGIDILTEPFGQRYHFLPSLVMNTRVRILYLIGYWQTYRVVEAVSHELRHELRFKEKATGKNLEIQNRIQNTLNSVSIHVRRGDYALAVEGNIVLPGAYYAKAVSLMQKKVSDPTFFVFSDDVPFARKLLPENVRKVFVDHNDDFSSHEDLRLMSSCEHHVIANSTFSWWGAWLNPRAAKIVIAPRHWHLTKQSYYPDLLPPEWLLLDTDIR
jgi:hypothetical protein